MSLHPDPFPRRVTAAPSSAPASRSRLPWPSRPAACHAMEIETGNPDLAIRWDNTVRVEPRRARRRPRQQDRQLGARPTKAPTASTRATSVAKRIDLLSEFDVVYKKRFGVRVSGTGWYDAAYGDKSQSNPNAPLVNIPSYVGNQYSGTTKRLYRGAHAASCSTPSSSAASTSATCRCRPSSAATRCTGASRCSSAATCTASPTRRTRSTCRRASPRPAPRPRSCSGR